MKRISLAIVFGLATFLGAFAQNANHAKVSTHVKSERHLSSSILLFNLRSCSGLQQK